MSLLTHLLIHTLTLKLVSHFQRVLVNVYIFHVEEFNCYAHTHLYVTQIESKEEIGGEEKEEEEKEEEEAKDSFENSRD